MATTNLGILVLWVPRCQLRELILQALDLFLGQLRGFLAICDLMFVFTSNSSKGVTSLLWRSARFWRRLRCRCRSLCLSACTTLRRNLRIIQFIDVPEELTENNV